MFHEDNTLELLEKYRKTKYNEKENGYFRTKNKETKISNLTWIPIVVFIMGYFIITNFANKTVKQEIVNTSPQVIQPTKKLLEQNIEIRPNKPITTIPQNTAKTEPINQNTTIVVIPQKNQQKQEAIKKIEEEEIRPSSSSSVGYYR